MNTQAYLDGEVDFDLNPDGDSVVWPDSVVKPDCEIEVKVELDLDDPSSTAEAIAIVQEAVKRLFRV